TLGRVQDLVLHAEQTKTPTQRLADLYASWHTPVILMLAILLFFFTKDITRVIALLVIAAPSSILLATPTALVAALSAAARLGLLVKNVADLERARKITAVVFDKTGTLTDGKLSVTRLGPVDGVEPGALLSAAVSVEQNSNHPAAKAVMAIANKARVQPLEVDGFEEVGGKGVFGTVEGQQVLVGRRTWLHENGINTDAVEDEPEGMSLLYVSRGGQTLGWIALADDARPDAPQAVDDLKTRGVRQVVMVSGDRWSVANRVAAETHCTDVQAEVLPAEKLQVVDGLKVKGHTVAVVGDGVNDAPALAAGDLSIAMGAAGSDVAINSASVALMNNRLDRIPFLLQLSRATGRVIMQGIGFSVVYIAVFGALAAAGYLPPIAAALLHTLSSIFVVFNSARLIREGEDIDAVEPERAVRETITPQPVLT
ncbi:MAG: heavy metal translocating P-type ATPase, partial [Planctomycetota bacterium]